VATTYHYQVTSTDPADALVEYGTDLNYGESVFIEDFVRELKSDQATIVDVSGNLFVAELFNHLIRKVDLTGTITTVVGTGVAGFSGDGGPATAAQLNNPVGMSIDALGNLYIGVELNGGNGHLVSENSIHDNASLGIKNGERRALKKSTSRRREGCES
jgi:hypothetical protein